MRATGECHTRGMASPPYERPSADVADAGPLVAVIPHGVGRYRLLVMQGGVTCLLSPRYRTRAAAALAAAGIHVRRRVL